MLGCSKSEQLQQHATNQQRAAEASFIPLVFLLKVTARSSVQFLLEVYFKGISDPQIINILHTTVGVESYLLFIKE